MNKQFFLVLFYLIIGFVSKGLAEESDYRRHILIVIGYSDDASVAKFGDFFKHEYLFENAVITEKSIKNRLALFGFEQSARDPQLYLNFEKKTQVTLLNANVLCPGESGSDVRRGTICDEQKKRSDAIKSFIEKHLSHFDEFMYIGHSRLGLGLGLGPFVPEYTLEIKILNSVEAGRLKKIVFASCDSVKNYQDIPQKYSGVQFIGSVGDQDWITQGLQMLLEQLSLSLNSGLRIDS